MNEREGRNLEQTGTSSRKSELKLFVPIGRQPGEPRKRGKISFPETHDEQQAEAKGRIKAPKDPGGGKNPRTVVRLTKKVVVQPPI